MMTKFLGITICAVVVEGIITYVSQFVTDGKICWQMLMSIILGLVVSLGYNLDILDSMDIKAQIPFIGNVLTGFLLARGSNYIADLLAKISG